MDETAANGQEAEAAAENEAMEKAAAIAGGTEEDRPQIDADDTEIHSLDFILDIPLRVSVEVGRTRILIRDLLQLGQGSVVELTKFAGEPLEMLVNDKLIARGEVVVVNEKFGLRLTDIISPEERIEQLK